MIAAAAFLLLIAPTPHAAQRSVVPDLVPPREIVQKTQPATAWKSLWDEARERARQGQYVAAASLYEDALGLKEDLQEARWELVGIWLQLKKPERALPHLERLLETNPNNIDYLNVLAGVLLQRGLPGRSVDLFTKVLEAAPGNITAMRGVADGLLVQGKKAEALPVLEKLYRTSPVTPAIRKLLAECYFDLGMYEKARPFVVELAAAAPENVDLLRRAAVTHMKLGLGNVASDYWRKLQRLEPANKEARAFLAEHYEKEGQGEEALAYLLPRLEREPDNAALLKRIGQLYVGVTQFAEALPYLERYVALKPGDKEILRLVVDLHAALGNKAETLASLERFLAVETQPELAKLKQAAYLYEAQGQVDRALPLYERILESTPDDPDILVRLAKASLATGDDQGAISLWDHLAKRQKLLDVLEILHRQEPSNVTVMLKLATMYLAKDALPKSRQMFEKLAAAGVRSPEFFAARANFYERIRYRGHALADYEEILRLFPDRHEVRLRCVRLAGELGYLDRVKEHAAALEAAGRGESVPAFARVVANAYRDAGAWQRAEAMYEAQLAAATAPSERGDILLELAALYHTAGRPYEAEQAARLAMLAIPERIEPVARLFDLALERHEPQEARVWLGRLEIMDQASMAEPESGNGAKAATPAFQGELPQARLLVAEGQFKEAGRKIRAQLVDLPHPEAGSPAARRDPARRNLVLLLSRSFLEAGKVSEAEEALLKEWRADGEDMETAVQLMAFYAGRGETAKSQGVFAQALQVAQADAGLFQEFLLHCREYKLFAAMREALRLSPGLPVPSLVTRLAMADAAIQLGHQAEALAILRAINQHYPEERLPLLRQAELLFGTGQPDEALQVLELLPDEARQQPQALMVRARILWAQGKRQAALSAMQAYLTPTVEELVVAAGKKHDLALPTVAPPGFWSHLLEGDDGRMPVAETVMAPRYVVSSLARHDGINDLAAPFYARFRWQQQLRAELTAKRAVDRREYFAAVKEYEKLITEYPVDGSVLFDLAGVYSKLDQPVAEAALYEALRSRGEAYPGLAEAAKRNQLKRRPHSSVEYGVDREEGREGYKAMRKEWLAMAHRFSRALQHDFAFSLARIDYHSTDRDATAKANRAEGAYARRLFSGLTLSAGGGVSSLENGYGDTLLAHCAVAGDMGDRFSGNISFRRDVVEDTVASLTRSIVQEAVAADLAVDLVPRLQVGGGYDYTDFSDNNWTQGYDAWVSYILLTDPTFLKLSYTYDFKDSNEGQHAGGTLQPDGFGVDEHPYWVPRSYWQKRFNVFFKHQLADDPYEREAPRYYTVQYTLAYDSRGYALQNWEGGFFVEWSPRYLLKAAAEVTTSQEYRSRDLSLSLIYRW